VGITTETSGGIIEPDIVDNDEFDAWVERRREPTIVETCSIQIDRGATKVRFQRPRLPPADAIEDYFRISREAAWFSNDGPCAQLLSDRLSSRLGDGLHCVLVANGTLGLMVALRALTEARHTTAHEVAVPSFTYIATVSAILWAGLKPVFVDVDADGWHAEPASLQVAVEERGDSLACLLPCSTFGTAPALETRRAWEDLARRAGLPLLVDSAAGLGSTDKTGQPLGSQGDAEIFSMHATKPFAVGEGGLIVTQSADLAKRMRQMIRFGLDAARMLPGPAGLNAKMSELHAATGLAVLDRFDEWLGQRRASATRIVDALSPHGFRFQLNAAHSSWQFVPTLAPDASTRTRILVEAEAAGVEMRNYHQPLHLMGPLRRHETIGGLEVTRELGARIVSLPMANDLDDASLNCICLSVLGALGE
jgi:dTDP-4-amino-4,6-dideoxygalactose transaminase